MALFTGGIRGIDGYANCVLLSGVWAIMLAVEFDLPLSVVEHDEILSSGHDIPHNRVVSVRLSEVIAALDPMVG